VSGAAAAVGIAKPAAQRKPINMMIRSASRTNHGDYLDELIEEMYFPDAPRTLDEILAAEKELFDKVWYDRSMLHEQSVSG
jgi:hypothetical protein